MNNRPSLWLALVLAGCTTIGLAQQGDFRNVQITVSRVAVSAVPSQEVTQAPAPASASALIPVENFFLPNGLNVVFHIDRSDPVVAVALNAYVGSARELPGRTGFAHLFEHLFFLESENLGKGGIDKLSARIGGSGANGSTNRDMTDYFQTVPNDALEKMIWAEADKLGYFINTVTEPVLTKEKQVVKNEKREVVDNQPYGHTSTVVAEALYPADHPYSWEVIGSLADLDAATLNDVKDFYRRWYTPGNVTLVVAGDFDPKQARVWVEKYFAEIPASTKAAPLKARPAGLAAPQSLLHEDNFAKLPELTMVWPTVPALHADYFAIEVLADLLSDGKEAPLHAVLVDQRKVTSKVIAAQKAGKLAGELWLSVRAFESTDLDQVKFALDEGFAKFERDGVDIEALVRVRTQQEVSVYDQITSVLGKANRIARYDLYAGDPDFADREIAGIRAVTAADVMRVYGRYVKGRPYVATSFVPKGEAPLALAGATRAKVVEESIVQGAEAEVDADAASTYARTPASFDRSVEPPYGSEPELKLPAVWQTALPNGLELSGIENNELPVSEFELAIDGGRLVDDPAKPGVASLLARMLTRGTARRTTAELEDALKSLGAKIEVEARDEHFVFTGRTLARNFGATINLLEEMLLEPRWDTTELALAKAAAVSDIQSERAEPASLADRAFEAIIYGENHIYARSALGTERSVAAITMDDLKHYHVAWLAPNKARFRVVGSLQKGEVKRALADLCSRWARRVAALPSFKAPRSPAASKVYFYDVPDAKQSVFAFGTFGPKRADPDYYPATVTNYILGGGGFASRLPQELRERRGYTYGISSYFSGGAHNGLFRIDSGVRSNVTLEAAALTRDMLSDYATTFTDADLAVTQSYLTKSRARAYETQEEKLSYLADIGDYGLPADYPRREQAVVDGMTVAQIRALAAEHIRPDAMTYVIVGDAQTQASRLKDLGFGEPVIINETLARLNE